MSGDRRKGRRECLEDANLTLWQVFQIKTQ